MKKMTVNGFLRAARKLWRLAGRLFDPRGAPRRALFGAFQRPPARL
jgi:hypothetical protein